MSARRSPALANPATIRDELRRLQKSLVAAGGSECITGDIDDPNAPCIRSVIQLDGDIITEVRASGSTDENAALISAHRADVDDWFRRLHDMVRNAQLWIVAMLTVVPAVGIAAITGSLVPMFGLVGAGVLSAIRGLKRAYRLAAMAVLFGISLLTAWSTRAPSWSWLLGLWGVSVLLVVMGSAAGYVAQRWVRRQLTGR